MKTFSNLFLVVTFSIIINSLYAQDIFYTISGEIDNQKVGLVSILEVKDTEELTHQTGIDIIVSDAAGETGTFTDARDNQTYSTIEIGNQIWMAENLKYLPAVVGGISKGSETIPYYYVCDYNGTVVADAKATANYTTYGVLYNWPAAMNSAASSASNPSGVQGVCPSGWHLPSDSEWTELSDYLINNGYGYGGSGTDIAKSLAATSGWGAASFEGAAGKVGNDQATNNSSGFTALPGGNRYPWGPYGKFNPIGHVGYWWSSSEKESPLSFGREMDFSADHISNPRPYPKANGFSVRCLKD